jgi:hypothetical protein
MRSAHRDRPRRVALLTVGLTGLLAACGGQDETKPAEEPAAGAPALEAQVSGPDACALIPPAELEKILGSKLAEAELGQAVSAGQTQMTACGWRTADGSAGVSLGLRRGAQYSSDPDAFSQYASGMEENMGTRPEVEPVPGLGSAALWDATNHVLMVRPSAPGSELNVQPYLGTKVPMVDLPTARAVAELALRQLEKP